MLSLLLALAVSHAQDAPEPADAPEPEADSAEMAEEQPLLDEASLAETAPACPPCACDCTAETAAPEESAAPEEPAAPKPETSLTAELGGSYTVGNVWVVNVVGGVNFSHTWGKNAFATNASTNLNIVKTDTDANGTLDDAERATDPVFTSQRVAGGVRYDRSLTDADNLFASAGVEHDRLAGLFWRFNQAIGYKRALVATERTSLGLEVGVSYNEENFVPTTDPDTGVVSNDKVLDAHYMAARVFLGFRHAFNDSVQIGDDLEMIEPLVGSFADGVTNFEDFRLNNTLFLQAKLSDVFSIKLSSQLAFDNQPVPTFVKVDHTTALTLVASIF